jgi:hypothetical protein
VEEEHLSTLHVIEVKNVRAALPEGLRYLGEVGLPQESRAGRVLVAPGPVATCYERPWQCALSSPVRDANPFFHLYEACWMLAGRDESAGLDHYVKDFGARFAEEGGIVAGAYGYRWRFQFGFDQLSHLAEKLRDDPATRQAVLQMWDATVGDRSGADDLRGRWRDRPCNTQAYFRMRRGALDMLVTCRSNDMVMGAYGANAVHFAFLHQYLAARVGVPAGTYTQLSNDFHAYVGDLERLAKRAGLGPLERVLGTPHQATWAADLAQMLSDAGTYPGTRPLVAEPVMFDTDLGQLMRLVDGLHAEGPHNMVRDHTFSNPFLEDTVLQALAAHAYHRAGDHDLALHHASELGAPDWAEACWTWLKKREKRT